MIINCLPRHKYIFYETCMIYATFRVFFIWNIFLSNFYSKSVRNFILNKISHEKFQSDKSSRFFMVEIDRLLIRHFTWDNIFHTFTNKTSIKKCITLKNKICLNKLKYLFKSTKFPTLKVFYCWKRFVNDNMLSIQDCSVFDSSVC